ncbi:MAG: DUF308 domain-containing protein [Acholeplasmatales bacterium]|jgi:uncharacterized BrkB/YihY/UPF0761 family membrane protein|nr:DUF308 domain-containing protein [Acholeplasmatales bacterium]
MKNLKKYWLIHIIVGVILLTFGIVMVIKNEAFINYGEDGNYQVNFTEFLSSFLLIVFGYYLIFPKIRKASKKFKYLYVFEFVLILFVSLLGFLIPAILKLFGNHWRLFSFGTVGFWYGVIFLINGIVELFYCSYAESRQKLYRFILGIISVVFGTILISSGFGLNLDNIIKYAVIYGFLIIGAVLIVLGLINVPKKESKAKSAEDKKEKEIENKKEKKEKKKKKEKEAKDEE